MSRIIVKNLPKFVTEQTLQEHFKSMGSITDTKIARDQQGNSRKFGFIGFKDHNAAQLAIKNYHQTYIGVSKIQIEKAKTRDDQFNEKQKQNGKKGNDKASGKILEDAKSAKKFKQYQKIVKEGAKKSWDDLVMAKDTQAIVNQIQQKKTKKMAKEQKIKAKQKKIASVKPQTSISLIKTPKLNEKNKKYFADKEIAIDQSRLYITNIPYQITESQLEEAFKKYGTVKKVKLPKEYDGKNKGYAFVTYQMPEEAMRAFSATDNRVIFGRILHVKPAVQDIGQIITNAREAQFAQKIKQKYGDSPQEKTSFKKKKKKQMRDKLNDTTSWNTLFLNPNTILEYMSKKLGTTKSEILLDSTNLAPKIALAQTEVIQETKQWMTKQKLDIQFLSKDRNLCERSDKVLLVKNLNYRVQQADLNQLFEFYGIVEKILLAPNRAIAIVEYQNKQYASNAFQKLQNFKFKNNFLYLQYAPINMMDQSQLAQKLQKMEEQNIEQEQLSKIVYVKNLSFQTTDQALRLIFAENIQEPKSTKIIRDKQGKSMGYGFIEFSSNQIAIKAIKKLQNYLLDGHKLLLSVSRKKKDNQSYDNIKQLKEKIKKEQKVSNKLVVRNLAFQATKEEVRELFKGFGSLRIVRLPKKMNGQHRGFGFVEFDSAEEAALAKEALSNTHLYGRKLVIEYEKGSDQSQH